MGKDQDSPDGVRSAMSRRSFLRGSGIGAASTVMLDKPLPQILSTEALAAESTAVGPLLAPIILNVNGTTYPLEIDTHTTLAEALRDRIGLTGTKIGCDRGACSACTVWLDGLPIASCMVLAIDVGARKVTTIEGIAQADALHPVQSAFIAHDAVQCGFCTPGLVMSAAALLERTPNPSAEEVKRALSGHICRCGTIPHVIAATLDAADQRKG